MAELPFGTDFKAALFLLTSREDLREEQQVRLSMVYIRETLIQAAVDGKRKAHFAGIHRVHKNLFERALESLGFIIGTDAYRINIGVRASSTYRVHLRTMEAEE